jgi:hypothetical protein
MSTIKTVYQLLECLDALDYPLVSPWGESLNINVDETAKRVIVSVPTTILER